MSPIYHLSLTKEKTIVAKIKGNISSLTLDQDDFKNPIEVSSFISNDTVFFPGPSHGSEITISFSKNELISFNEKILEMLKGKEKKLEVSVSKFNISCLKLENKDGLLIAFNVKKDHQADGFVFDKKAVISFLNKSSKAIEKSEEKNNKALKESAKKDKEASDDYYQNLINF